MPLTVHRSNRTEVLAGHLAQVMCRPLPSAFAPELLVVEGRGLERWLGQQVARQHGIWANVQVLLPRAMVERTLDLVAGADPGRNSIAAYEPEVTLWAVADLLGELLPRAAFAPLRAYLQDAPPGSARWLELCERLARTLDAYAVYRPRWVRQWEQGLPGPALGPEDAWQPELWRALVQRLGPQHAARRAADFFAAIARGRVDASAMPARVHLFGLTALAPLYLHVLVAMATHSDVHFYVLSPSEAFWSDIRRGLPGDLQRWRDGVDEADLHQTLGNPLLASLGRQGRDLQRLLEALTEVDEQDDYRAAAPYQDGLVDEAAEAAARAGTAMPRTMLQVLQEDMRLLQVRTCEPLLGPAEQRAEPLPLDPDDRSLSIHCCHSPLREVEVLRDALLQLFDRDPDLTPGDVAVLTPDIDTYAPFVDAVFGAPGGPRALRYSVADRSARHSLELVDGLLRLAELASSRFEAPAVLDLLASPALRRRFDLRPGDVERIAGWIREAGVRWGIDAAHRQALGHPPLVDNTWRAGLDRLLLGYAMPTAERALYAGVLPHDDVEGQDGETLGALLDLCHELFAWQRELRAPRSVADWALVLGQAMVRFFGDDDALEPERELIQRALDSLVARAAQAGHQGEVALDAVLGQLERLLEGGRPAQGFLRGAITFCGTVPMRAIPFKVLALLGLNDDSFPRQDRRPGFDLMARQPRPGDRSRREDDRYLFLEALLSARQRLIITYTGRSVQDNAVLPPSVVVSELLDTLVASFYLPGLEHAGQPVLPGSGRMKEATRRALVQEHPLQPFSPRNFAVATDHRTGAGAARPGATTRSYDQAACRGATALLTPPKPLRPFVDVPLPGLAPRVMPLPDLLRWARDPLAWFFVRSLGLQLDDADASLDAREPLHLDGLERWQVGTQLLQRAQEGVAPRHARALARASQRLPLGRVGDAELDELQATVTRLAGAARPLLAGLPTDLDVDLELGATRLQGTLRQVRPQGLIQVSFSRDGGPAELRLWLQHLVLCALAPPGVAQRSILITRPAQADGEPESWQFAPVADALARLDDLRRLLELGSRLPLPVFPRASWTYARTFLVVTQRDSKRARILARRAFEDDHAGPAECDRPLVRQAFGHGDPLELEQDLDGQVLRFDELALRLYGPLLEAREAVDAAF